MMKNKAICFPLFALLFSANTVQAQLSVASNGKVYVQRNYEDGNAMLGVGESPMSYYYEFTPQMGICSHIQGTAQQKDCVGVFGEAYQGGSNSAIGVWGQAWGSTMNNKAYGVLGTLCVGQKGAGIVGTTEDGLPPSGYGNGYYAGYFYGDTYVDEGYLTAAYGFYNLSDMRLKENVVPLSDTEAEKGSVLDGLLGLEVIEYNLKRPHAADTEKALTEDKRRDNIDDKAVEQARLWAEMRAKRRHYGVSAQELQKIYPNLVAEGQDGYLTVNYTEMIPLLLQCIKELKAEVDELSGAAEYKARNMSDEVNSSIPTNSMASAEKTQSSHSARLYQNTPNPFSERTEIRFSLPDDAQDAQVCIFDMSGKMLRQLPVNSSMHSVTINGYELSAGMYLYSLVVGGQEIDTKRMILSK